MRSFSWQTLAVLAVVAPSSSSPVYKRAGVINVPIKAHSSPNVTAAKLVASDKARITRLFHGGGAEKRQGNVDIANDLVSYIATIKVGKKAVSYDVIVDTGSSNTWVGADKSYTATSTATDTGESISVSYGSGSFSGEEYTDTVTLGSVTVTNQGLGVASTSDGFSGVDGILGLGPEDLTDDTVGSEEVPTFMQNAVSEGQISENVLGVYLAPATTNGDVNGVLTLGGTDSSYYSGSISYTSQVGSYWGASVDLIAGGDTLASRVCILDTGTTLIYLTTKATTAYFDLTSFSYDSGTGLYRSATSDAVALTISLGGTDFTLAAANTLVPKALYSDLGLDDDYYYSWIASSDTNSGDTACIIGMKWLEHFYSVYDTDSSRVGFAIAV